MLLWLWSRVRISQRGICGEKSLNFPTFLGNLPFFNYRFSSFFIHNYSLFLGISFLIFHFFLCSYSSMIKKNIYILTDGTCGGWLESRKEALCIVWGISSPRWDKGGVSDGSVSSWLATQIEPSIVKIIYLPESLIYYKVIWEYYSKLRIDN